jgi:hypothetical protein
MKRGKQPTVKAKAPAQTSNGQAWETFPQPRGWALKWDSVVTRHNGRRANAPLRRKR